MPDFLSLPTELIIEVSTCCPRVYTAALLGKANRQLHAIWLKYNDQIITSILKSQVPGSEGAEELALAEVILTSPLSGSFCSTKPQQQHQPPPPARLLAKTLIRNAYLASAAIEEWTLETLSTEALYPPDEKAKLPHYASFYLFRKLLLGWRFPITQLHYEVCTKLEQSSLEEILMLGDFFAFLACGLKYGEKDWAPAPDQTILDGHWLCRNGVDRYRPDAYDRVLDTMEVAEELKMGGDISLREFVVAETEHMVREELGNARDDDPQAPQAAW